VKKGLFAREEKELIRALENEVQEQNRCYVSEDCKEGLRAFFEKRRPKFQSK
jgi:enoyl-CoA hydratase/carnithine racemase